MITNSYNAFCYLENDDGEYHIECDMQADDCFAYADYTGDNFVDGINSVMNQLTAQMTAEPELEDEYEDEENELTDEERLSYLEGVIDKLHDQISELRDQNAELKNALNTKVEEVNNKKLCDCDKNINQQLFKDKSIKPNFDKFDFSKFNLNDYIDTLMHYIKDYK